MCSTTKNGGEQLTFITRCIEVVENGIKMMTKFFRQNGGNRLIRRFRQPLLIQEDPRQVFHIGTTRPGDVLAGQRFNSRQRRKIRRAPLIQQLNKLLG
ncbi:hypothetical protein KR49_00020 [Synechococcus sp. KORDI-49]|nr:hypothetical protein KR49_00020 [Synechococcus sp. KORDI-49]